MRLILILIILLLTVTVKAQLKSDSIWVEYNDLHYFKQINNKKVHPTPWFSPNYKFRRNAPDGYYIVHTPLINITNKGRVRNGKKTGFWHSSDSTSRYTVIHRFEKDRLHGTQITSNEKGNIISQSNYLKGKQHGYRIEYYNSGIVKTKERYSRGKLKWSETYDENGIPHSLNQ